MSKYNNKKTEIDNILFASMAEARRYLQLKRLLELELISELELQPKFAYIGRKNKKLFTYIADFRYMDENGKEIIEDVKGFKTAIYRLKKKLIEDKYNVKITEILL